ncbi:MAG: phenylalanine--tRNA ligase subunit beta [Alphaproteobacteria bacterium]|nr:phenylalanine--tRNA ligase subunit beta [Alphaproteobacteria bacterium]
MKWTFDWLKEYLDTKLSADEIADKLTRIGLEVDDVSSPVSPIAAKIVECKAIEGSDHLHVLKVDDGSGTLRQVVCGAPNARVGLISALATPGCVIDGHEIKSGKLRGVLSDGMMCSERELGISDDHSGIMELNPKTKIGSPVLDVKTVFDAGITPNRPDYLSVRGIALDLSAVGAGKYIAKEPVELKPVKSSRAVHVKTDLCNVYRFAEIHNIKMAKSNDKIASRLNAIGINPKNAPVDATNYVCYDMGQPMHCFDADEIVGDITVRMAKNGEKFTDLFGNEHELKDTDIVIADSKGILALAGVVGGLRGATSDKTTNIILESAYFNPVSVRKTSKRIGLSTDSSYRYERGIDPTMTGRALSLAAGIIIDVCGGKIVGTGIDGKNDYKPQHIKYTPDMLLNKTGISIDEKTQAKILTALGYDVDIKKSYWVVSPRAARVDVEIPETIIADLIRIYGYEKIAKSNKQTTGITAHAHDDFDMKTKILLASRGLNECQTFGFGNSVVESLLTDKKIIKIANPIVNDLDTARNTLLGNLLIAVANNEKRGYPDLNLFELGTVFDGDEPGQQHTQICIVRTGVNSPKHWQNRNRNVDIYDVKADLIALMCGQKFTVDTDNAPKWAHPFQYGKIMQGKKVIAEFGSLHPAVAKKLHIKTPTVIAIVDNIDNLPRAWKLKHEALSDFQPITRDFAFVVDSNTLAESLTGVAIATDKRIESATVFDSFDMGDGKKSIAFTITIVPTENMGEEELQKLQDTVIAHVEKKCNAKLRA